MNNNNEKQATTKKKEKSYLLNCNAIAALVPYQCFLSHLLFIITIKV